MEEEGDQEEEEGGEEEEKEGSTEDEVDDDDDDGDGDDEGEKEPRPRKRKARKPSKTSKRSKISNPPAKRSHHSKSSLLVLPEGGATFVRAHMVEKSWVNLRFNENAVGQYQKQCLRRMLNEKDYPLFPKEPKREFVRVMRDMNDLVRGSFKEVLSTLTEGLVDEKGAPYLHSIRSISDLCNFEGCVDQHNHLDFLAPATSTEVGLISATSFVAKVIFFVLFRGLVLALVHQSRCYFLVGLENYCSAKAATSCPTFSIPTERFSRLDAFMVGFQRELLVVLACLSLHSLERLSIAAANTRLLFPLLGIRK